MTPPRINFILARSWQIAGWAGLLAGATFVLRLDFPTRGIVTSPTYWLFFLLAMATALPLGWLISVLSLGFCLTLLAEKINGAPFKAGDPVFILVGPRRGLISHVYSSWQGHSARINIDDAANQDYSDVFAWNQIYRAQEPAYINQQK